MPVFATNYLTACSVAIMAQKPKEGMSIDEFREWLGWTPPYDPRFPNMNQTK